MKWFPVFILLFITLVVNSATYYVAPWGNDDHAGTFEQPWATWQKAIRTARAGDTVYFRGGVYYVTSTQYCVPPNYGHNGTRSAPICYFNYPGEVPVLDGINCTTTKTGLLFQGASNIHLKGLHVRNFLQHESDNTFGTCIAFSHGNNITVEQCVAYNAGMRGFYLHGCDTALVLNCDAYNCCDRLSTGYEGGGGDGFLVWDDGVAADSVNHIVLRGCRSWNNSDDGYDIETEGFIGVESCWAWNNGYLKGDGDGFKFGFKDHGTVGLSRQFENCLALYNKSYGFDENSSGFQCMTANVFNCTSYGNGQIGFATCSDCLNPKVNIYKNNVAYKDARSMPQPTGRMKDSYNSWNTPPGATLTDADFISVDSAGISGLRKADGSLPDIHFMKPALNSDLINAGTDVELPYFGHSPDLGYTETNYGAEVLVTGITVSGTENTSSIVTDNGTLQLNKTIFPADATNQTVRWSIINGTGLATLSSTGLVTALYNGSVTVKATANDGSGVYGTMTIIISNQVIPVTGITLSGNGGSSSISTDDGTLQLNAAVLPSDATNKSVRWSVVNGTGQAVISSTGLLTAISNGTVTAKATANDGSGVYGTLNISISNQVIRVTGISVTSAGGVTTLFVDRETLQQNSRDLTDSVACKIASWPGIFTAVQSVLHLGELALETIQQEEAAKDEAGRDGTLQLSAVVVPDSVTDKTVIWSIVSGKEHALISSTGLITAISVGSVIAEARANDGSGVKGTIEINIAEKIVLVESILVSAADNRTPAISDKNGYLQLTAEVIPANASNAAIDWEVENLTGMATIDENGLVKAEADGLVSVVATASDGSGISGYCTVIISNQSLPVYSYDRDNSGYFSYRAAGKLIVDTDNPPDEMFCNVFGYMGVLMHQQKIFRFPAEIDISSFSPGIYIIMLTDGQQSFPLKTVIP